MKVMKEIWYAAQAQDQFVCLFILPITRHEYRKPGRCSAPFGPLGHAARIMLNTDDSASGYILFGVNIQTGSVYSGVLFGTFGVKCMYGEIGMLRLESQSLSLSVGFSIRLVSCTGVSLKSSCLMPVVMLDPSRSVVP